MSCSKKISPRHTSVALVRKPEAAVVKRKCPYRVCNARLIAPTRNSAQLSEVFDPFRFTAREMSTADMASLPFQIFRKVV